MSDLIVAKPQGLYCPPGDFYIDPWRPVDRAVITHGHSDHARSGHKHYLSAKSGEQVLRSRLGDIPLDTLQYGESRVHNGVSISLHPAGHVLGSAQVRLSYEGEVWVASGDYKLERDGTCEPFEPVRCHTFITESTFGLPIYRWQPTDVLTEDINAWWQANAAQGRASVLFCYSFGKAQRLLHGLNPDIGPIVVHGAVAALNRVYASAGVALPPWTMVSDQPADSPIGQSIVLAPSSAQGTPWLKRFGNYTDAFASGWMRVRGARRRRGVDRGFVVSDHVDWPGLHTAIEATGAQRVFVTHGSVATMVRHLKERGLDAEAFQTEYGDEDELATSDRGSDADKGATSDRGPDDDKEMGRAEASASLDVQPVPTVRGQPE